MSENPFKIDDPFEPGEAAVPQMTPEEAQNASEALAGSDLGSTTIETPEQAEARIAAMESEEIEASKALSSEGGAEFKIDDPNTGIQNDGAAEAQPSVEGPAKFKIDDPAKNDDVWKGTDADASMY